MFLWEKLVKTDSFCGINIFITDTEDFEFSIVNVKKKDNQLSITKRLDNVNGDAQLVEHSVKSKVLVCMSGKGVLLKKIEPGTVGAPMDTVRKAFPYLSTSDIFVQLYSFQKGGDVHLAVVRNSVLQKVTDYLHGLGIYHHSLFIGPYVTQYILPLLDSNESGMLQAGCYCILHDEGIVEVNSKSSSTLPVLVGGESLSSNLVLPFAAIISQQSPLEYITQVNEGLVHKWKLDLIHSLVYPKLKWAALTILLILLLVNFLINIQLAKTNDELKQQYAPVEVALAQLALIESELAVKKKIVDSLGWTKNSYVAYYGDQLAKDLNHEIQWNELTVYPVKKDLITDVQNFERGSIWIRGICGNPLELNQWIKVVSKLPWVQDIYDQKYWVENSENFGRFELKVRIREDE